MSVYYAHVGTKSQKHEYSHMLLSVMVMSSYICSISRSYILRSICAISTALYEKQQQQTTIMAIQLSRLHKIFTLNNAFIHIELDTHICFLLYYVRCVYHHAEQHQILQAFFLHILNISKNPHVLVCLFSVLYSEHI